MGGNGGTDRRCGGERVRRWEGKTEIGKMKRGNGESEKRGNGVGRLLIGHRS